MKKITKLLFILMMSLSLVVITGCDYINQFLNKDNTTATQIKSTTTEQKNNATSATKSWKESLKFESQSFKYDGEMHSIYVENVPEGAKVIYNGNEKNLPAVYTVNATVKYNGESVKLSAKMTIEKNKGVISCETSQTVYLYGGPAHAYCTIDNESQTIVYEEFYKPGVYETEVYANSTPYYDETEHILVTLTVKESVLGLKFQSKSYDYDNQEKAVTLDNVPDGYTVEYINNKATNPGKYYAMAIIKKDDVEVERYNAILTINQVDNPEFETYLDEMLVYFVEDDQLSVNIYFDDISNFPGLEKYEAVWYTYETMTEKDYEEAVEEFTNQLTKLHTFDVNTLSELQLVSYHNVEDTLNYYLNFYGADYEYFLMENNYIDQFGGYAADFATYMEAYTVREEADIQAIIDYINSLPNAFKSYITYGNDKINAGYPFSDYTIDKMIEYLDGVILDGKKYYLFDILENKIDNFTGIDETKKAEYKTSLNNAITNSFIPAYQTFKEDLLTLKGYCGEEKNESSEGYLSIYEGGKEYFALELANLLGYTEIDMDEFIKQLDSDISSYNSLINNAISVYQNAKSSDQEKFLDIIYGDINITGMTDPNEMMEYLKEFAKTIVPELASNPEIVITNMDDSVADTSTTVAYYMKSAVDNTSVEYIHLNPKHLEDDYFDTLSTLAHEGYPGHLYSYVFSKDLGLHPISIISTCTGYGEGWATYVQECLCDYIGEESDSIIVAGAMDYIKANSLLSYNVYTRVDIGIHYEGWDTTKIMKYMNKIGYSVDEEGALDIYRMFIECPTQYASYGYGQTCFYKAHEYAKESLGEWYDEIEFNTYIQSHGWVGLEYFMDLATTYVNDQLYLHGVIVE